MIAALFASFALVLPPPPATHPVTPGNVCAWLAWQEYPACYLMPWLHGIITTPRFPPL